MELVKLGPWSSSSTLPALSCFLRLFVLFVAEVINARMWEELVQAGRTRLVCPVEWSSAMCVKGESFSGRVVGARVEGRSSSV